MKFEVGDRVVATTKFYPGFKGKVGTVVSRSEGPYGIDVKFDFQKKSYPFSEHELEKHDG